MTVKLATCACHIAIALLAMLMLTLSPPAQARSKLSALHETKIGQDRVPRRSLIATVNS